MSKFGERPSSNLGDTLLKRAIFAAIRTQFEDDLYSSRWRFETDWKIAILISAE